MPNSNQIFLAICKPLSTLTYSKSRVILLLLIIWSISTLISLPEAVSLSAISILDSHPCVVENIFWDLTSCVPDWSDNTGLVCNILKTVILYILPFLLMLLLYINIIKTLWRTNLPGNEWGDVLRYSYMLYVPGAGRTVIRSSASNESQG